MNNKHILDLTLRLSQALDQNYDVVSMETVLSVITALEGTIITKEQLEATRLAKYINQLRRRTKCEKLARRAKSLLKKWREMVGMQQTNESAATCLTNVTIASSNINTSSTVTAPFNIPASDNAVSTSHLTHTAQQQLSQQHYQRQKQYQNLFKQQQQQPQQPYYSQPSSPINHQEKSNHNEFLISISNPATAAQIPKSSNTNLRKKRCEKNLTNTTIAQQQQQPTSFANLITGLGSSSNTTTLGLNRKTTTSTTWEKTESTIASNTIKPVETFIIEHSSNSNSDLICLPTINNSNNNVCSSFTSATDVPPVVIDLQDTNSSMNSLVSKDVANVSSSFYSNKISTRKLRRVKKRRDRNITTRQNLPLQDCDDHNTTTTTSYHHHHLKRRSEVLLLEDEKSHSACPTISNISDILSLSNSSICSVFPSADAMSKNIFQSGQNELVSPTTEMTKSDLTFAGKFKQTTGLTTATTIGCNVVNYNSDSINTNKLNMADSPNRNKFSFFGGGIEATISNDSSSSSRTTPFHDVVIAVKGEGSNSRQHMEDIGKHDMNEKSSVSNMSNKGNSSTDNTIAVEPSPIPGHTITAVDFLTHQIEKKQPKKRGRKKGSKGVDSVIAKETSLTSQMLKSSLGVAGKKVKTTKELYAEMENRKLRNFKPDGLGEMAANLSANWTGQRQRQKSLNSRSLSFCSDINESDSCTMTSEPSGDSGNILSKTTTTVNKNELPNDNNINYLNHGNQIKIGDAKSDDGDGGGGGRQYNGTNTTLEITKIKLEIQEILKLLAPPKSVRQIEYECFNTITPCTCSIEEITAGYQTDNETNEEENIFDSNSNGDEKSHFKAATNNSTNSQQSQLKIKMAANAVDCFKQNDKEQIRDVPSNLPQTAPCMKAKKSIFDLDFEDDEDPLHSIIADIEGKCFKTTAEIITVKSPIMDTAKTCELLPLLGYEDVADKVFHHQTTPHVLSVFTTTKPATATATPPPAPPVPPLNSIFTPSYKVKFDSDCKAQNRFEIQTQKITKFHIDNLHNCFIPNVNGNWNHANDVKSSDPKEDNLIFDGYNVVPLYCSDINEQIVKDLSHVKFTKNYKIKQTVKCNQSLKQNHNDVLFYIPFLGVSRIINVATAASGLKLCAAKELKKNFKTYDEEKENFNGDNDDDDKLNLNNELKNIKSALDTTTTDTKERDKKNRFEKNKKNIKTLKMSTTSKMCKTSKISKTSSNLTIKMNKYLNKTGLQRTKRINNLVKRLTIKKQQRSGINFQQNFNIQENEENIKKIDSSSDSDNNFKEIMMKKKKKKHKNLFYHEEICPVVQNDAHFYKEFLFHISSCSSGHSTADEEISYYNDATYSRQQMMSASLASTPASLSLESHMFNFQQEIIPGELAKRSQWAEAWARPEFSAFAIENNIYYNSLMSDANADANINKSEEIDSSINRNNLHNFNDNNNVNDDDHVSISDSIPVENNYMLLSFNNIYDKFTCHEITEQQQNNKQTDDSESNMLNNQQHQQQQQLQNCDDYNNINNDNFNLIKYIDNKTSSFNNINNNNNNTNSCNNYYSVTNLNVNMNVSSSSNSNSSCSHENQPSNNVELMHLYQQQQQQQQQPQHHKPSPQRHSKNDNNNVQIMMKPFKEYQTGIRAVDEDVNDEHGNNCGRLQKFKEWHEVLQLRSYNDELLTVLPYVVLE